MGTRQRKRYLPAERGRVGPRVLATVSLLALTLATAWFARSQFATPVAPPAVAPVAAIPAERYLGVVQLAPDAQGRCEQFEIDNRAGVLRSKGQVRCDDITATTRAGASRGPLQNVGGYFKSH